MLSLAIVIPAFKASFLDSALASLAAQTDRHFTVYVGDDASPEGIEAICRNWEHRLDLRYHRFDSNLGGSDLVSQWERCIALSNENWVSLFGDDDEMGPDAVAQWRTAAAKWPETDLWHFNVVQIDARGKVIGRPPAFPEVMSARTFAHQRLKARLSSYAPDYVFRRAALESVGGFQRFPLAWCSDDATWIKLAAANGIRTVPQAQVRWRMSGLNISTRKGLGGTKVLAAASFLRWLDATLPTLARSAGEPSDEELMDCSRFWLYQQAMTSRARLWPSYGPRVWATLRGVRGHHPLGTLLRTFRSDLRVVRANRNDAAKG